MTVDTCPICDSKNLEQFLTTSDFTVTNQAFGIIRCRNCSLLITSPRPDDEDLGKYYLSDDYISHSSTTKSVLDIAYVAARTYMLNQKWKLVNRFLHPATALDYGCGTGSFVHFLQKQGVEAYGIEPSQIARDRANDALKQRTVLPRLAEYQKEAGVITLWHVLEHVPNLEDTLASLKEKLSETGYIFIAVPNPNSWESVHYTNFWAAYDTPRHLWHFTQQSMTTLLKKVGFKLVQTAPLKLDAFYISLMSEKYKNGKKLSVGGIISAVQNGFKSNMTARKNSEYSSLIYIAKHDH